MYFGPYLKYPVQSGLMSSSLSYKSNPYYTGSLSGRALKRISGLFHKNSTTYSHFSSYVRTNGGPGSIRSHLLTPSFKVKMTSNILSTSINDCFKSRPQQKNRLNIIFWNMFSSKRFSSWTLENGWSYQCKQPLKVFLKYSIADFQG